MCPCTEPVLDFFYMLGVLDEEQIYVILKFVLNYGLLTYFSIVRDIAFTIEPIVENHEDAPFFQSY